MKTIATTLSMTALQTLSAALGKDKNEKHAFIVSTVATIIALALCKAPPKGQGNPADHAKLADTFTAAKLPAYAAHCAAFPQFLKGKGRSVEGWDDAYAMAVDAVVTAFAGCAPKSYTPEQVQARDVKKAEKKAEREKAEKQAEKDAADAVKTMRADAFADGVRAGLNAQAVADAIRAGQFDAAGLKAIRAALADEGRTVDAAVKLITA